MWPDFIKPILEKLPESIFWLAIICLVFGFIGCRILATRNKTKRKILYRQIKFGVFMFLIFIAGIGILFAGNKIYYAYHTPDYIFPKDVAGILVLRINGDDSNNSLQTDIVSSLNTELAKESLKQKIEVHGGTEIIDESAMDLSQAHKQAKQIGQKSHAILVIWGNKVAAKKIFHPRITIISEGRKPIIGGECTLNVQNISEIKLPEEVVFRPIYITHFVVGYSLFNQQQYSEALEHFEIALNWKEILPSEVAILHYFAGNCHLFLGQKETITGEHLSLAIDQFKDALNHFEPNNFPDYWAAIQNNLGCAYFQLPTGTRKANLEMAITCFKNALNVYSTSFFPEKYQISSENLDKAKKLLADLEK